MLNCESIRSMNDGKAVGILELGVI